MTLCLSNLEHILKHFSQPDWDRVALAAQLASQNLELDVNRREFTAIPKPSSVPDLVEPAVTPTGVTLQALSAVVALAVAGTRAQRLQLLFYLLMDELLHFLEFHPAGGVPVWLLEVDAGVVTSLASLTHYHYYGTAFLPLSSDSTTTDTTQTTSTGSGGDTTTTTTAAAAADNCVTTEKPPFCASKSRTPIRIQTRCLKSLLTSLFLETPPPLEEKKPNSNNNNETSSEAGATPPVSDWLQRMQDHTTGSELYNKDLDESRAKITASFPLLQETTMTLEDFGTWAEGAVDETCLRLIMHRLFAAGIFPTPSLEKEWVAAEWHCAQPMFQQHLLTPVQQALSTNDSSSSSVPPPPPQQPDTTLLQQQQQQFHRSVVWGGLGGLDGGGGIGHGLLYCIDRQWWDAWVAYTGWSWLGEPPVQRARQTFQRPRALTTERLLASDGTAGSYQVMKHGLKKNKDYVLVPPGVWNVLYELYGGGPPLPRMVRPPQRKFSDSYRMSTTSETGMNGGANGSDKSQSSSGGGGGGEEEQGQEVDLDDFVEQLGLGATARVMRLPESLSVSTHPWILHCQLCDPTQPYRRGDAGLTSIRAMVTPDEPLWRLFAEVIARLPLQAFKAFDSEGMGKARLWKRTESTAAKGPISRYGPWNLLCKSRHAEIPMVTGDPIPLETLQEFYEKWKGYTDNATVESILLADEDRLLLEFAVQNKHGDLIWPREAAAKAGKVKRLVEEENEFRRLLQGVDTEGTVLLKPPNLVAMDIDAMDASGRWYPVKILEVDIVDVDSTDDDGAESDSPSEPVSGATKKVKVDFSEHGGHVDWIDVESDRLGPPGRFTNEAEQQAAPSRSNGSANSPNKNSVVVVKKSTLNGDAGETTKLCVLPGYGACGLTNLGNTCYMNSALQCISYLPLLRAYLLSSQYKATGDLNKDNPLGTGGKFLEESADLLRVMWSARLGEKSPTRFKSQLGKINSQFSGADQQDAQEFLNYMLDVLHEDSNKVRKKPYVEALEDDWVKKTSLPRVGEEAWRR
jgi:hypothetical protein